MKSRHGDAFVYFRVGDFYELFCGDGEEDGWHRKVRASGRAFQREKEDEVVQRGCSALRVPPGLCPRAG